MSPITPPDHRLIAEMAAAILASRGTAAQGFVEQQLMHADGAMVTTWAALLTHLQPVAKAEWP